MLNAPKPVHINLPALGTGPAGATLGIYTYETGGDGTVALRVTVPGMGAGPDTSWTGGSGAASVGSRSTWRKASWIWLRNMNATNDVAVSFDNGNNYITIRNVIAASNTYDTFTANLSFRYFLIKAAAATATVECIVGINGPN